MDSSKIKGTEIEAPIGSHGRFLSSVNLLASSSQRFSSQLESGEMWWRHLVYLVVDCVRGGVEADPEYLGDLLASAPLRVVASELLDQSPKGLKSSLQKLRPHPLPSGYYRFLIDALNDDCRPKLIHHAKEITVDFLDVLRVLPDQCLCSGILGAIKTHGQAETLVYLIDAICTYLPECEQDRLWRSTQSIKAYSDLEGWFGTWLNEAPFPMPPWEGNGMLRPIRSPKELLKHGRQFENCLKYYVYECVAGAAVFYHWTAGEPVIVLLRSDAFFKWVVDRMEGGRNARHVSPTTCADIVEQFSLVGIRQKPHFQDLDFPPFVEVI